MRRRFCYSPRMSLERPPEFLDTVAWERDGGLYSGIVQEIRGEFASIFALHGGQSVVHTQDLQVLLKREAWDPEALVNHLWAVYGIRLFTDDDAPSDKPA